MEELIQFNDQYYILASASPVDERTRVLKQGETFAVFDQFGDIRAAGLGEQGIYHEGTRFVSRLKLRLAGIRPLLLSSTVNVDNAFLTVDLTNPDIAHSDCKVIPRGTLHIFRSIFLWQAACYERLRIKNFGHESVSISLSLEVDADFADIFEVRGTKREQHGRRREARTGQDFLLLEYEGLDRVLRQLRLDCVPFPSEISAARIRFLANIERQQEATFSFTALCRSWPLGQPTPLPRLSTRAYDSGLTKATTLLKRGKNRYSRIATSSDRFNEWWNRSVADLQMMTTETPCGLYPDAGVPWFSTRFGRDGIITAMQTLWINPDLAAGVLRYLASTQAQDIQPERDAEPGKILHETRKGEMAALGEIPFGLYYGSVDATPLFVMLAGEYLERTDDRKLIGDLWPNIELALRWIDDFGDSDGDGFVEYARQSSRGLVQQGWKDSWDAVFHSDGTLAEGPIALCEVQAYVYAAKRAAGQIARVLGHAEAAHKLEEQANLLRERFEEKFWCEELSTYALALDGKKRPCRVRTSNAGHALFGGIASYERARLVAETLLGGELFSGWGIRTVAASETSYNPMSYHNGSVWPHDNSLIVLGLSRYGFKEQVASVMDGLMQATVFLNLHRLPELFCGFRRRKNEAPTLYPVACSPQAWAAASVFAILQASLGLTIRASEAQVSLSHSFLPEFLQTIEISDLKVGSSTLDLSLRRFHDGGVSFRVNRRRGPVEVVATG